MFKKNSFIVKEWELKGLHTKIKTETKINRDMDMKEPGKRRKNKCLCACACVVCLCTINSHKRPYFSQSHSGEDLMGWSGLSVLPLSHCRSFCFMAFRHATFISLLKNTNQTKTQTCNIKHVSEMWRQTITKPNHSLWNKRQMDRQTDSLSTLNMDLNVDLKSSGDQCLWASGPEDSTSHCITDTQINSLF